MTEFWQEVHIRAAAAIADQVCHEMAELGCVGTTVEERTLDTFIPPDPDEILSDTYLLKPISRRRTIRPTSSSASSSAWPG